MTRRIVDTSRKPLTGVRMVLNEQAVLQSLMQWRSRISAAAWLVVRNTHTAEDIFQNVVLKAMTREVAFESENALLSWAFITARREGIDWIRANRLQIAFDETIMEQLEHTWLSQPVGPPGVKLEALQECIEAIPTEARVLLRLRYGDNLNCEEVAQKLSVGRDTVYKRLSRLHYKLRDCVERRLGRLQPGSAPS